MMRAMSLTGVAWAFAASVAALSMPAVGANAEALPVYPPVAKGPPLSLARPDLAKPVTAFDLRYAQAPTVLPRGVAKTSVERREGGVTGSAGVLCGLQPTMDDSGVGTARGYDNEGRFVGAKLAFSF
jgi:hypothetical protein